MTEHQGPPKLVCFDWGGVILRICRSWREGVERAGLPIREEVETDDARARRKVWALRYGVGHCSTGAFARGISEACDGLYSPEDVIKIHHAWLIEEYPGVRDIIDRLNAADGVETALLSNTNEGHWQRHLPANGDTPADFPTIGLLTHRIASHHVGYAKPHEHIYRSVEHASGCEPGEILFFDDLAENIEAARSFGWRAEQIDHEGDTAAQIESHLGAHGIKL
ncbi:MAG: HAD-IA family hydrolase [Planctomycetota bacterium]